MARLLGNIRSELKQLSSDIWHNPELAFKEHGAHDRITDFFVRNNIGKVTKHYLLDTAFKVEVQIDGEPLCVGDKSVTPCVAFFSEFDALPGIGHACGHNLIAVVGVAAFLETVESLKTSGSSARIVLLGSPGEESGGGKVLMMEKGALKDIDFAMMSHPAQLNCCLDAVTLAVDRKLATFHGESVHGVVPWQGRNALDAAVLAYSNLNALRHRMNPAARMHGIFTDGGKAPNVIPERAQLYFYFRAPDKTQLRPLVEQAEDCFRAGAMAAGCTVEITGTGISYDSVKQNSVLGTIYRKYMESLGYQFPAEGERSLRGSTDMGDVSRAVPAIHAWFRIPCHDAPCHSVTFRDAAKTEEAFDCAMDSALSLSKTAVDVISDSGLFSRMKSAFL